MLRDFAQGLKQLAYPATCVLCTELIAPDAGDFCSACRTALTSDPHTTCPRCSSTVGEHTDTSEGCNRCRDDRFYFEGCSRLGPYDGLLRDAILRMKHGRDENLAESMGSLWAESQEASFRSLGIDVVVPVPLHWWRRLRRRYNQSAVLAAAVAARLGIPHHPDWLRRTRWTRSQVSLSATERRSNLRGAFAASRRIAVRGKRALLIDDVLTTGTTASEAARVLRDAGAVSVHLAVLAHR